MKKLIGITGVILIACICISSLYAMPTAAQTSTVPTATALAEPTAKSVENYIIKSENNVIVVYKAGESTPYIVTEARTDNLPKGDDGAVTYFTDNFTQGQAAGTILENDPYFYIILHRFRYIIIFDGYSI